MINIYWSSKIYFIYISLQDDKSYNAIRIPIIKILTDEVESKPILDFELYSNIVRGSDPKFSIGIYGDWGTRKTTLMKLVEKKFENDKIFLLSGSMLGSMKGKDNLH